MSKTKLDSNDHLLILGDAGIIWDEIDHHEVRDYYNNLPCTTLFLDGNHENFDLLDAYPVTEQYGGKVHRISDKITHLMRGEVYLIENKTIFVFGGGYSAKKKDGTSPVFIWEREMPNDTEYTNGLRNLEKVRNRVDFIMTHVAPTEIATIMGKSPIDEEMELNDYLSRISSHGEFSEWYFGHYHTDEDHGKYHAIYMKIRTL